MRLYTATSERRRLVAFLAVALAVVAVLSGRLLWLQIFTGQALQVRAAEQWYRDLPLMAERGTIYDHNGVVLATSNLTYSVYLRPVAIKDKEGTARKVADYLGLAYENVLRKASSTTVSEWLIKMQVDKATALQLAGEQLPGVYLSQTYQRSYPVGSVGAQVLGLVSVDNHGQEGLEAYYDDYLRGQDGKVATQSDLRGIKIVDGVEYYLPAVAGDNLVLNLDAGVQNLVQNIISRAYTEHQAKSVSALVVDIRNGGIVASAAAPYYDLNEQPRDDVATLLAQIKNSPMINVLEPGSTFKIITLAAALEEGVVSLDDKFMCAGSRTIAGERIKCWKTKGHGIQTLAEGVNNSCNCVFMDLALRLGVDKYYDYLAKFGIGQKAGVDFYGEPSGLLLNKKYVRDVDLARIGFGQAIAVSPVQFIATVSALVGDGNLRSPRFVDRIGEQTLPSNVKRQILSPQTSATLSNLLYGVVTTGSGKKAAVPGYQIGGKTGTAQKYQNGVIAQGKYVSSFLGYLSVAGEPRYACYLYVDEPSTGVYYGSIVAAPYVGEIFATMAQYLKLPYDPQYANGQDNVLITVPDVRGLTVADAERVLTKAGCFVEVDGDGDTVTGSFPVYDTQIKKGRTGRIVYRLTGNNWGMNKQEYAEYIKKITPKSKMWGSLARAFLVGGLICLLGEGIGALYGLWLPQYDKTQIGALVSCTLIFLAAFLTGIGVYDKIGYFAGGGSIVPITGFSNSITSAAMEYRKEGIIFGTCANMFKIAGPVIVVGVAIAMLCGLGYFIVGLFL